MKPQERMLRRNLTELLPEQDGEFLAVLVECVADELQARGHVGAFTLRAVAWNLFELDAPRPGNLRPIFSGDCEREDYRAKL